MGAFLTNLGGSQTEEKEFENIREKVWEYVKSGECFPEYYAIMVDAYELRAKKSDKVPFGKVTGFAEIDTIQVNKNRKEIGLPSILHGNKISLDFIKSIK